MSRDMAYTETEGNGEERGVSVEDARFRADECAFQATGQKPNDAMVTEMEALRQEVRALTDAVLALETLGRKALRRVGYAG